MKAQLPFLVSALLSVQLLAVPAGAQLPEAGARLRATMRDSLRFVGTFRALTADTLTISGQDDADPPRQLLLSSLGSLEVSRGNQRGSGAVLGGLAGILVGGLVGGTWAASTAGADTFNPTMEGALYGGVAGLFIGGFSGYHMGARERWVSVNLDDL